MMRRIAQVGSMMLAMALGTAALAADELTLTTGETLRGRLVEMNDEHVVFEHPLLGELTLPRDGVDRVLVDEVTAAEDATAADDAAADDAEADVAADAEPAPATDAEPAAVAAGGADLPAEEQGFFAEWDSSLSLGFSGSDGDTRNSSYNVQFQTQRENDYHRWIIEARYFYGQDNGESSQNEFRGELTKDWLYPDSPWFFFANGVYQFDHFRPWRHRAGAYAGVGYEFIKREDLELIGRLGFGGNYEFRGGQKFTPEALVGASLLRWHITENQNLTGSVTLYPNLEDRGEYRLNTGVEWTLSLSEPDNMSVKLGVENQYETDPGDGAKHNNLKYYGGVVFEF